MAFCRPAPTTTTARRSPRRPTTFLTAPRAIIVLLSFVRVASRTRSPAALPFSTAGPAFAAARPKAAAAPAAGAVGPDGLLDGTHASYLSKLSPPAALSPTSVQLFRDCPQAFLFRYLYKVPPKSPPNPALAKGSVVHSALERLFDLEKKEDRTEEVVKNLVRQEWAGLRNTAGYSDLFRQGTDDSNTVRAQMEEYVRVRRDDGTDTETDGPPPPPPRDIDAERSWGEGMLALVDNYFALEDPAALPLDPVRREVWVRSDLAVDPGAGGTAPSEPGGGRRDGIVRGAAAADVPPAGSYAVRGIVDRLDLARFGDGAVGLVLTDYKTGKAPAMKYGPQTNRRIMEEKFWQLKVYALLLRETEIAKGTGGGTDDGGAGARPDGRPLRMLQLMYLTSAEGPGRTIELDLGDTPEARDAALHEVHADLSEAWVGIHARLQRRTPLAFEHCGRKFCDCHAIRPFFRRGTVWERGGPEP